MCWVDAERIRAFAPATPTRRLGKGGKASDAASPPTSIKYLKRAGFAASTWFTAASA